MFGTGVVARVHVIYESYISLGHMCCNNNNINHVLVALLLCSSMVWLI
jgi:hypothetical protein